MRSMMLSIFGSRHLISGLRADDLWQLLLRMAGRKVIDKRRHDLRQRRGGDIKHHPLGPTDDTKEVLEAIAHEPSPEMVLMMQEFVESFFSHLGEFFSKVFININYTYFINCNRFI